MRGFSLPSKRRHTRCGRDWSSDVCSSDLCSLIVMSQIADSSAMGDMTINEQRPYTWTSADAAGLPIFVGLARYDEVAAGAINHALRYTVPTTQRAFVAPASHWASTVTNPSAPPMGARLRLKATFAISGFPADDR